MKKKKISLVISLLLLLVLLTGCDTGKTKAEAILKDRYAKEYRVTPDDVDVSFSYYSFSGSIDNQAVIEVLDHKYYVTFDYISEGTLVDLKETKVK
ncbi:gp1 [Listeria phage A511]|uniref:Gp1 n=1 Tax=Listeria phage A511 TaxID=2908169 RepID=A8AT25_BPA51|nr:gp1 [Listeria phage A511]AAY52972.1 gp1 [Listeria phage A511]ACF22885.1 gp1 [Listeria phage A511]